MLMAIQRVSTWTDQLSEAPPCVHIIAWLLQHLTMRALSNYLQNVRMLTHGIIFFAAAI